jgi:hypothetical protein
MSHQLDEFLTEMLSQEDDEEDPKEIFDLAAWGDCTLTTHPKYVSQILIQVTWIPLFR